MTTVNDYQRNELQETTATNAPNMTTERHQHIYELQNVTTTEATNKEKGTTETTKLKWLKAGSQYNTATNYARYDKEIIGRMREVCHHCNAQKWKKELPGLTEGIVSLTLIEELSLILRRLLQ